MIEPDPRSRERGRASDGLAIQDLPQADSQTLPLEQDRRPRPTRRLPVRQRAGWAVDVGVGLVYLALAAFAYLPAWQAGPGHTLLPGSDPIEEVWFLATVAHHLLQGNLPLHAASVNAPEGANLLANTSMPLLGLLGLPLITTVGPVVAYNALMTLAFPVSAFSAYLVFRRWVPSRPARAIGGLVFGFAPYVSAEGLGHLFLMWVPLLPVFLLLADELLVRQRWPAGWTGLAFGVAAALQFFISAEVFATAAVMLVGGTALLAICWPRTAAAHLRHAVRGAVGAAVGFLALAAYPIWYQLDGPEAIHGPVQALLFVAGLSSDLFSALVPTTIERFAPAHLQAIGSQLAGGGVAEVGSYLGIVLAVLLVWIVARAHRDAVTRIAAVLALSAYVLSMGPTLRILGVQTKIDLPEALLFHLPLYDQIVPGRLAVYMWLFVALILARWLGGLRLAPGRPREAMRPESTTRANLPPTRLLLGRYAVVAVALVALVPAWPYPTRRLDLPSFFTTSAVDVIPRGANVLTYPWVNPFHASGLLWAAVSALRFRVPGGYIALPNPAGGPAQLAPHGTSMTATLLDEVVAGERPAVTPAAACQVTRELHRWHIEDVVVSRAAPDAHRAVVLLSSILGPPNETTDGVVLWTHPAVAHPRGCSLR